jgi:hypothetical protein
MLLAAMMIANIITMAVEQMFNDAKDHFFGM